MFSVLRRRNFALLWIGQFVSLCGDWLLIVALPFYVYQMTGSILQTGLLLTAELLPRIVLGSLAGVFVDRWDRRWTMLISDLLRAGVLLLLLLVHSRDLLWLIYVVAVLQSIIGQFFTPAVSALTPSLVEEHQLVAANSLESFNDAVTRFIGPPLGGILLGLLGLESVVLADSATFLFSALTILLISVPVRVLEEKRAETSALASVANVWREWLDGLGLVAKNQTIGGIFATFGFLMVGQGILNVLLIVFIKEVMHRDAQIYGWMITAQGVGSLLGAILVGSVSKLVRPVYLIVPGLVIAGVCILVVINYPVLVLALSLIAFVGIFVVGTFVSMQTLLQQSVADSYRGRLFGTLNTTISVFMLVGMLLASGMGAQLGVVPLLEVAGIFTFLAGLVALAMLRDTRWKQTEATGENTASSSLPVGEA